MKTTPAIILLMASAIGTGPSFAQESTSLIVPVPDSERGRFLFASKGCVVCHSINGIGGKAGPRLDAEMANGIADPLNFAARMWRGATAMALVQSMEFGYQISITGQDIADLSAFLANPAQRAAFSERDIPEIMLGWTIDEPFGELEGSWDPWDLDPAVSDLETSRIGNLTRGHMLAERWCTTCHVIDADGEGGVAGPQFAAIAARPEASEAMIVNWLSIPHEAMPEFLNLSDDDLADMAAYIMSLKR